MTRMPWIKRAILPLNVYNATTLELVTTCGPDDQFSSPLEIRCAPIGSPLAGKLLVLQNASTPGYMGIRNADLSFYSNFYYDTFYKSGIDCDASNLYIGRSSATAGGLYKLSYAYGLVNSCAANSIRMIDASGHADYVFVTSDNDTGGHGVRMVKKSNMTVVASMLATGTGDSQFTHPLGLYYVAATKKLYICEATRICVLDVTDTPGAEALAWSTSYAVAAHDLTWDGTNWYTISATTLTKYDSVFTDGTKVTASVVGYSITLIPNQGDGADGVAPTLGIVDSANSHIERRKTSDLTQINSVGSSGDGSASLFDPTLTTSIATRVTFIFPDINKSYTTALGTSHALYWNGFAGFTYRSAGPHKMLIRVVGGLGLVTAIDSQNDSLTLIKNLNRCNNITSVTLHSNGGLKLNLADLSNSKLLYLAIQGDSSIYGNLASLGGLLNLSTIQIQACPAITGNLSSLSALNPTNVQARDCPLLQGSISSFVGWTNAQVIYLYNNTNITPSSIATLVNIRDIRIYSMGWLTAGVDTVISSMWGARASYTYAAPSMQIGGTNQSPTGTYAAPSEGADWHLDGATWIPLTGKAMIYDLVNDVNGEGFHVWTITYTT